MLRSVGELRTYMIAATDGEIGTVDDMYFDDESWVIRYLVVDTGRWLPGRKVLILPVAVEDADWVSHRLHVSLTRERIRNSPSVDAARPISRQQETEHFAYYGYPAYWSSEAAWGPAEHAIGAPGPPSRVATPAPEPPYPPQENHLRSAREVIGYELHATDGQLGEIHDFLADDTDWAIRYIVVATGNWWSGRKTLIPPEWMYAIDWRTQEVRVHVSRESVRTAPPYDEVAQMNRQWEAKYFQHHGQRPYWTAELGGRRIAARQTRAEDHDRQTT